MEEGSRCQSRKILNLPPPMNTSKILLDSSDKAYVYEETRKLLLEVEKANGSLICKDLLESKNIIAEIGGNPEARTTSYYDNRPCSVIVYNTTKVLEDYLINKSIIVENK